MRLIRRLHLYLGLFFAPMLVFYVGTGWYQTFNPNRVKSPADAVDWVAKLRSVHVDQIYPTAAATAYSPRLYRWLAALMAAALLATVLLGTYLAFKTLRRSWLVAACLVAGVALPALLLWLGQRR